MTEAGIVFMTASSRDEAETIARSLVEKRLAACVNIISSVDSLFWWEGKLCREREVFLIAKTPAARFAELEAEVKSLHSYDVPEIIFTPVAAGSQQYLDWISEVTKR